MEKSAMVWAKKLAVRGEIPATRPTIFGEAGDPCCGSGDNLGLYFPIDELLD